MARSGDVSRKGMAEGTESDIKDQIRRFFKDQVGISYDAKAFSTKEKCIGDKCWSEVEDRAGVSTIAVNECQFERLLEGLITNTELIQTS